MSDTPHSQAHRQPGGRRPCPPFVRTDECSDYRKRVIYAVHGFWSGDNVSVTQHRHYLTSEWESPQVKWSCGGREPKAEPDDLKAAECFGLAILDAVSVARQWAANASDQASASAKLP